MLSPTTISSGLIDLSDIAAFDQLAQPKVSSPCHITDNLRKSPCSQLCFAIPNSPTPSCGCARGVLKGRTCEGLFIKFKINKKIFFLRT